MKWLCVTGLLGVIVSCSDASPRPVATQATASVQLAPDIVASLAALPAPPSHSSICARYERQRAVLLMRLTTAPRDSVLLQRAKTLIAKHSDACT